jgi:heme-degrading monooxygenase HmoA
VLCLSLFARTPKPPYYAVVFTSKRTKEDQGYAQMSEKMLELASQQPGFLGAESTRDENGFGITVSYWSSLEAIENWRKHSAHQVAQQKGREEWYSQYHTRVCKVERDYGYEK